jgi:hypothetical protein
MGVVGINTPSPDDTGDGNETKKNEQPSRLRAPYLSLIPGNASASDNENFFCE